MTFTFSEAKNPAGKLADAEVVFTDDDGLAGLKLVGFAIWARRDGKLTVTFPARQYSVNGERRSFSLLRPTASDRGIEASERLRDEMLAAFVAHEAKS